MRPFFMNGGAIIGQTTFRQSSHELDHEQTIGTAVKLRVLLSFRRARPRPEPIISRGSHPARVPPLPIGFTLRSIQEAQRTAASVARFLRAPAGRERITATGTRFWPWTFSIGARSFAPRQRSKIRPE